MVINIVFADYQMSKCFLIWEMMNNSLGWKRFFKDLLSQQNMFRDVTVTIGSWMAWVLYKLITFSADSLSTFPRRIKETLSYGRIMSIDKSNGFPFCPATFRIRRSGNSCPLSTATLTEAFFNHDLEIIAQRRGEGNKSSWLIWMILFVQLSFVSVFLSACGLNETSKEELVIEEPVKAEKQPTVEIEIRDPRIPDLAYRLKRTVRGEINYHWGIEQDGTVFYAQIHQESSWNPEARSVYASGLAQFTPDTADWISRLYPADLGDKNPLDVRWAIRALVKYDKWLYDRSSWAETLNDRWCFSLSSYNGGAGWVDRDRKLALQNGRSDKKWICNVQHFSNRADWAIRENRDYVDKILNRWVPLYEEGGFI
jgi:hypothetical protein